jgi:endogenous inhibitor of DNA gyrase (YacG/DUF329 family)
MRAASRHVCPICGRDAPPRNAAKEPGNKSFPFCSPACKLVDLGRWLDGGYRIPGAPVEAALDDDDAGERE